MKRWYIPSWHGDLRLERAEVPDETLLTIEKPTADEQRVLNKIGNAMVENGWLDKWTVEAPKRRFFGAAKRVVRIKAAIETVGPVVAGIMRPGPAVLTCIKLSGGQVVLSSAGDLEKGEQALPPAPAPAPELPAPKAETKPKPKPEAAVTVKRPTPSCPQCEVGAIGPASEVLLEFLDDEQHADWAEHRSLVAYGGMTGRPYLLAHRNSPQAALQGRICMDLSLDSIVHFHDRTVPPEEEVLAAKLILEHREPWLRNEATMLGLSYPRRDCEIFDNPFGGVLEGTGDASLTERIGAFFMGAQAGVSFGSQLATAQFVESGLMPGRALDEDGNLVDALVPYDVHLVRF